MWARALCCACSRTGQTLFDIVTLRLIWLFGAILAGWTRFWVGWLWLWCWCCWGVCLWRIPSIDLLELGDLLCLFKIDLCPRFASVLCLLPVLALVGFLVGLVVVLGMVCTCLSFSWCLLPCPASSIVVMRFSLFTWFLRGMCAAIGKCLLSCCLGSPFFRLLGGLARC